jgi:hypothetical protein
MQQALPWPVAAAGIRELWAISIALGDPRVLAAGLQARVERALHLQDKCSGCMLRPHMS